MPDIFPMNELNTPDHSAGAIRHRENVGRCREDLVGLWDAVHAETFKPS
jgi:hypothetical protein